jgi:creatinine amidohydrolase
MAENILIPEMTWTEVEATLKDRPVAILPVGATEAHGPHLPVSTDTVVALELSRRVATKLKEHGIPSLILPAVSFAVADYGEGFAGTITISPETSVALLKDISLAAAKRFRCVAFANSHFEPRHLECLKKAAEEANKAGGSACYTDLHKKRWADALGETFRLGDHAGAFETSLMMATAPQMVRERERISLAPIESLNAAFKKGAKTFEEAGAEDAYCGDPTAASAEEGEAWFEALAKVVTLNVMEHLGSKA